MHTHINFCSNIPLLCRERCGQHTHIPIRNVQQNTHGQTPVKNTFSKVCISRYVFALLSGSTWFCQNGYRLTGQICFPGYHHQKTFSRHFANAKAITFGLKKHKTYQEENIKELWDFILFSLPTHTVSVSLWECVWVSEWERESKGEGRHFSMCFVYYVSLWSTVSIWVWFTPCPEILSWQSTLPYIQFQCCIGFPFNHMICFLLPHQGLP